jgi:hypothetical protein
MSFPPGRLPLIECADYTPRAIVHPLGLGRCALKIRRNTVVEPGNRWAKELEGRDDYDGEENEKQRCPDSSVQSLLSGFSML